MPTIKLRTVGRCIYCRATAENGPLTDEHVVPFALGGNLVIAEASCDACQKKTSAIEREICRPMTGMVRRRLGLQTRRKKQREAPIPVVFTFENNEEREVLVDAALVPSVLSYPTFATPGLLSRHSLERQYRQVGLWSLGQDDNFMQVSDKLLATVVGAIGHEIATFRPTILMNFVAKVAHAGAVGLFGLDGFQPMLAEVAVNADDVRDDLLGGAEDRAPTHPDLLHSLEYQVVRDDIIGVVLIAHFRWFACLDPNKGQPDSVPKNLAPPSFLAVVGRPLGDTCKGKFGVLNVMKSGHSEHAILPMPGR